jgi:uncharacterized protein (UPF0335 family)
MTQQSDLKLRTHRKGIHRLGGNNSLQFRKAEEFELYSSHCIVDYFRALSVLSSQELSKRIVTGCHPYQKVGISFVWNSHRELSSDMYNRGSNFQDMIDGLEHDRNGGYSPGLSTTVTPMRSAATSSKAVLTALRALQDKISRLESEKTEALEESARLRLQIQNQDMTSERYKQRDNLTSQKNLHEVRTAYDRILAEKSETEMRLSKLDDRNRAEEQIAIELRAKIRAVEDEKHTGLLTIKDLESERTQLQSQILHIHQKEKGKGILSAFHQIKMLRDFFQLSQALIGLSMFTN